MRTLGRINRATYWLVVAVIFAAGLTLQQTTHIPPQGANILLLLATVPRLHDFGRAGWAALAVLVLELAAGMAIAWFLPQQQITGVMVIALLVMVFLVVVGSVRGSEGANRFGAAPAAGISYSADRPQA